MVNPLDGKVTLVTGATRGVGKGVAIALGEAGATVYVTGRSLEPAASGDGGGSLRETQAAVEAAGGRCVPVQVDHGDDEQVRSLFDLIQTDQHGQLDLLVNNAYAGVNALKDAAGEPFWKSDPTFWDACNNVGLRGHYIASVFAARMMAPRQQGLICTISSWGSLSYIFGVPYGVGKAACDRLAADMAVELKRHNVASLSVWPGIVGTEAFTRFAAELQDQETPDTPSGSFWDGYNWETPLLTGRAIASLAADPAIMRRTGRVQIVAELAEHYGLTDQDGNRPASLRSLRFLLPQAIPALKSSPQFIPNLKLPWWVLLQWVLPAPKI